MNIDISRLNLSEKDIENYLWENPGEVCYFCPQNGGFVRVSRWIGRQFDVPSGIIDLLGVLDTGFPVVVEVKNVALDGKAVSQVARYTYDIYYSISARYNKCAGDTVVSILIGTSIDNKTLHECEAAKVIPLVFQVKMNLLIDRQQFSARYEMEVGEKRYNLSKNDSVFSTLDSKYVFRGGEDPNIKVNVEDVLKQVEPLLPDNFAGNEEQLS